MKSTFMAPRRPRICWLVLSLAAALIGGGVSGCLASRVSNVQAEGDFDWNTLKRDQILMTPLLDLRGETKAPDGKKKALEFFKKKEAVAYAETFKQEFFRIRKDIRVFGAGGAFEHLAGLKNLDDVGRQIFDKKPLSDADLKAFRAGSQDIRFVFAFAITDEKLDYDFDYRFRKDQQTDLKTYYSRRHMTVRLALWDSVVNKTVWLGTEPLIASEVNQVQVFNPTKHLVRRKGKPSYWVGIAEDTSLERELRKNRDRFPDFPKREPALSKSFEGFALALPLNPEEEKLIEYEHFTHPRLELGVRPAMTGATLTPPIELRYSAAIWYFWRFGLALQFPVNSARVRYEDADYQISSSAYGATFDYEWVLDKDLRLLTGFMAGAALFTIAPRDPEALSDEEEAEIAAGDPETADERRAAKQNEIDGTLFIAPRAFLLFGEKTGFQWGFGASGRFYEGIEDPQLAQNKPSPWSLDLAIAYAWRGM